MLWLVLSLASAALLGGYEVSRKHAVRDNPVFPTLLTAQLAALVTVTLLVTVGPRVSPTFQVIPLTCAHHLAALIKAAIVTAAWILTYLAVKHLPISIAAPLRAASPIVSVLGGVLIFDESPTPLKWLGIFTLFGGYFGLSLLGRHEGIHFTKNKAIGILVLGTIIGATSGLYDKHLLQGEKLPPTTLQFWFTAYSLALQLLVFFILRRGKPDLRAFTFRPSAPLAGILLVIADQFYFRALAEDGALISVVALVRRSSVLLSFSLGGLLFREQLLAKKAWFVGIIALGLILIFL